MHEGFTNYQTYLVYTFIAQSELVGEFAELDSSEMKITIEDALPFLPDSGLWYDLIKSALDLVNWDELVESLRSK